MNSLILDMQRKLIGGYMNAEECGVYTEAEKILQEELYEELFDLPFHKTVVNAINHVAVTHGTVSDYLVLDYLQTRGQPETLQDETEYNLLQSVTNITHRSFKAYEDVIVKDKLGR